MKILLFGATGLVGDGVLRWLVESPYVDRVVAVSRRPLGIHHVKIDVVIEKDMFQLQNIGMLEGFDACFFCLGASSVGMTETEYRHLTYDLTLAVACQLLPRNPRIIFELISGGRADVDAKQMWSRVKAETENAVLKMGFFDAYALRPGYIQPMRGASSRYRIARWIHAVLAPIYPILQRRFDRAITSTDLLAEAMLQLAIAGNTKKILSNRELNELARSSSVVAR